MPSFGERLKLERVKRAITLEQISSSTKIGTRMLQALEEENFDQLPGGIFNKGFVRAYARHVGLDEDQAVADYLEASGQNAPATRARVRSGRRAAGNSFVGHSPADSLEYACRRTTGGCPDTLSLDPLAKREGAAQRVQRPHRRFEHRVP